MTNKGNITVYTGSSSDLVTRVWRHKNKYYSKSFSGRYNLFKLVHYEFYDSIAEARRREIQLKAGSRKKKELLINSVNPKWTDLWDEICEKYG